jgi:hypothetical protein
VASLKFFWQYWLSGLFSRENGRPRVKGLPIIGNAQERNENNLFDKLTSFSEKYGEISN